MIGTSGRLLSGLLLVGVTVIAGCDDTGDGTGGAGGASSSGGDTSSSSTAASTSPTGSTASSSSTSASTGSTASSSSTGPGPCDGVVCGANASCDGTGACVCDAGFQDHDGDSTCAPACDAATCSGNGSCDDTTGAATCTCDAGYTGASCGGCDAGFYEYPAASGTCIDDPCDPDVCNGHGSCSGSSGSAACTCFAHFVGATCDACATGYTGSTCSACALGYYEYPAGSGTCIDDPCAPDVCAGQSTCSGSSGAAVCTCDPGYAESGCDQCVRYVDLAATGAGTGTTWGDAFTTLQAGIDAANTAITAGAASCEVWVREGTYYVYSTTASDTVTLRAKVALRGGFAGTETARASADPDTRVTTISGRKSAVDATSVSNVVTLGSVASVTIDGFTIRDGIGSLKDGGGIRSTSSNSTVTRCTFESNATPLGRFGAAISAGGTTPTHTMTLTDSTFKNNTAVGAGGAVSLSGGEYTLSNLTFTSNTSGAQGGGLYVFGANVTVTDSVFTRNRSVDGGAIAFRKPGTTPPVFTNLWIADNFTVGGGGGFYTDWAATGTFTNVAFVGNRAGNVGGAAFLFGQSGFSFNGCTMAGNGSGNDGRALFWDTAAPTISNSIVWGNPNVVGAAAVELRPANGTTTVATTEYSDVRNYALGTGSMNADPMLESMPDFYDWTTGTGTTTSVTVTSGTIYAIGDAIEIDGDGVSRTVTGSTATTVSFMPSLVAASEAQTQIRDWGAGLGAVSISLDAGSPCIDAADAASAPATDIFYGARNGLPDMGCLEFD